MISVFTSTGIEIDHISLFKRSDGEEPQPCYEIEGEITPTVIIPWSNTKQRHLAEMADEVFLEGYRDDARVDYVRLPKEVRDKIRVVSMANVFELLDLALLPPDTMGEYDEHGLILNDFDPWSSNALLLR